MRAIKLSIKSKSLVVTSLGVRFILLMMAIGIAAINTGNNLLYLILAMMLSMMVISGVLSDTCLYRLRYKREFPDAFYAGQPARITFVVTNEKKIIPSFSLLIEDSLDGYSEGVTKDKYFFKLPPHSSQKRSYPLFFSQRGVYPLKGVTFSTRFPFGIFQKIKKEEENSGLEIVVFPRTFKVSPPSFRENPIGTRFSIRKGQGASLYQFRLYSPGDDARSIHWKTSARKQKLVVREYEEEKEKIISIGISNFAPVPPTEEDLNRFEKGIELAASYVVYYLKEGFQISFFTDQISFPLGRGSTILKEILTCLATLKGEYQPDFRIQRKESRLNPVILISPLQQYLSGPNVFERVIQPEEIDRLSYWKRL
ncbi:MAG: DUF58 domain-containing protein [Nitrospiria bacterium]